MTMRILNLGCGHRLIGNAVNHDVTQHRPEIDVVHDLNRVPWPWPDNSFDQVVARSVFEHLSHDLVRSMDECWRILAPKGQIFLKLPLWNSESAHDDPTHRWYFTIHSFDQFDPTTRRGVDYGFYTPRKWRLLEPPIVNRSGSSVQARLEVLK
jgi:SAM-dependent methyltransferase